MSTVQGVTPPGAPPSFAPPTRASQEAKLRETARQLEGVFVQQLFAAMRSTVPEDGLTSGGMGEDVFRGMMDQHLAAEWPKELSGAHSLSEALFRQLREKLPPEPAATAPAPNALKAAAAADTTYMTALVASHSGVR